ncbi:DUF3168 domain-containing protein [Tianweitania sediminis]|uniref:DUF3168 domain-containing protein n=1 Tax=Tianweitania sediminis TaxID=1502156 RepID=A0A8J7QZV1_9HYPH|nr:DUF3168 domain-containing protein [Tianweitania sediminis]MBP0438422.1 DUF3168 domain-containing protein [Tianweitania sediminis]
MSPSLELQGAIVARLKTTAGVSSLISTRVYDAVPKKPDFPYVTVGEGDETSDDADCVNAFEISLDIDVWSRAVGFPEAKRIADAIRRALKGPELALQDNALVEFRHRQTRTFRDPDGQTSHAVLTFEAIIEQP